ncbi:unnamed protein product [Oikopleura dioica]|uniref:DNA-directed RNA polymerases I, II, and III subunit RPABC3 n=1 Tax=Oikopleura dioica TaxID=34765 RepID=E4XU08_OIKDI|nr:unnamed protein product [Oikopleura dioica]CBY33100.1 unnamed protein product [Oikopleura dioica]
MSGVLYEEIFNIKDIDPEGKQFERVKRIHAECESSKMELILDVNSLLYSPQPGDKFRLMLATTLNDDGEPDAGEYDPRWEEKSTRTAAFDYIMHGLIYRISGDEADTVTRLEVYISFGGLLMRLNGEVNSLSEIKIDEKVYLLLRKLSY